MTRSSCSLFAVVALAGLLSSACGSSSPPIEARPPARHRVRVAPTESQGCCIASTTALGPHTQPTIAWRAQTDGRIVASPTEVSCDGQIVVGSLDGSLYRFTADGTLASRVDTGAPIRSRALAISNRDIVVANERGAVMRIDPNGTIVWRTQLTALIATDPISGVDGMFYVAADGIYAIDQDGAVHWHHVEPTTVYEQPWINENGLLVFGTVDGRVVSLDPTGLVRATRQKAVDEPFQPRIATKDADGIAYVVGADQMLRATRGDGSELWGYSVGANVAGSVLLTSTGTLVVGADDGNLYALH